MKKLLLLAAAALSGLCSTRAEVIKHIVYESTITPVSQLQDGHIYLIYDASKVTANGDTDRRGFRKVEPGSTSITGLNASKDAADLLYDKFAWQAVQDGTGWKFHHLGTDLYIQAAAAEVKHMTVVPEAQAGTYTLEDYNATHGAFRVRSTANTAEYWDGLQDNREMCTWHPGTNFGASHWYQFFEVTDDMVKDTYSANVKLTYPDGTTAYSATISDVPADEEFTANDLPFYIKNALTFTTEQLESGEDIALEFADGFTPFKLFNALYQRWGTTNDNGMTTVTGNFSDGEWYLEEAVSDNVNFKVYSAAHNTYFGEIPNADNPTPRATAENAQVYHLTPQTNGAERIFNTTGSHTNVSWNIRDYHVAGWTIFDRGSYWFMVYDEDVFAANRPLFYTNAEGQAVAEPAEKGHMPHCMIELHDSTGTGGKLAEAQEQWSRIGGLSEKSHPDMETIKANLESAMHRAQNFRMGRDNIQTLLDDLTAAIDAAAAVEVSDNQTTWSQIKLEGDLLAGFVSAEEAAAWQSVIDNTVIPVTEQDITDITAARNRLKARVGGVSIHIRPSIAGKDHLYICADNANEPTRSAADTSRAWTLIHNSDNTGFYLYNEYTGRYMKHAAVSGGNETGFVTEESEASVYNMEVYNVDLPTFSFKTIDSGIADNRSYLHSNLQDYLQIWSSCLASSFYVNRISDYEAANEHFNGTNDVAGETAAAASETVAAKPAGSDLSQYTYTFSEAPALASAYDLAAGFAADEECDITEFRAATKAYRAAYNAYTAAGANLTNALNMPAPGDLLRLKWVSDDGNTVKYASNENNGSKRLPMLPEESANSASTVWYVNEDNKLVSFTTGLCIGNFNDNRDTTDAWGAVISTSTHASAGVNFEEQTPNPCHYLISTHSGRHIYGANPVVDAGGGLTQANASIGYQWMLERVHMLPIPVGDVQFTTVHAPVDLNFDHSEEIHAVAHTGKIVDATVEYTALAANNGTYLPANTPALLKVNARNGGHVYAEVVYPAAAPAEQAAAPYAADDETAETDAVENHFKSDFLAKAMEEGISYYVLNTAGDAFEPLPDDATYVPGFAAHLAVSDDENPMTSYTLKETTSIEEITADGVDTKADAVYYDLCGRRVAHPTKGIYVTGTGKKVLF